MKLMTKRAVMRDKDPTASPLLTAQDLASLRDEVNMSTWPAPGRPARMVEHMASGDTASVYTGPGMDYEESRLYQPGDDIRFMNWRLSARTGKQFIKVFREERRPDVYVLIDRRSSMRYGTRYRLKVTQAAICASTIIYMAQKMMLATGALILQDKLPWIRSTHNTVTLEQLLSEICSPCPSVENTSEPALNDGLRQCLARLVPGSVLVIISDFTDINGQTASLLRQLSSRHAVSAVNINDPSEKVLQSAGYLGLTTCNENLAIDINLSDKRIRRAYESLQAEHQAEITDQLKRAGIATMNLDTTWSRTDIAKAMLTVAGIQ